MNYNVNRYKNENLSKRKGFLLRHAKQEPLYVGKPRPLLPDEEVPRCGYKNLTYNEVLRDIEGFVDTNLYYPMEYDLVDGFDGKKYY